MHTFDTVCISGIIPLSLISLLANNVQAKELRYRETVLEYDCCILQHEDPQVFGYPPQEEGIASKEIKASLVKNSINKNEVRCSKYQTLRLFLVCRQDFML